jgi:hypothetical protein
MTSSRFFKDYILDAIAAKLLLNSIDSFDAIPRHGVRRKIVPPSDKLVISLRA